MPHRVDEGLATNAPGVWALGDCNGRGAFTHTAYNDFEIVAANLLVFWRLADAVSELGGKIIGEAIWNKYKKWPVYSKFFDNMGPIPHHMHQSREQAALVKQEGKPERRPRDADRGHHDRTEQEDAESEGVRHAGATERRVDEVGGRQGERHARLPARSAPVSGS